MRTVFTSTFSSTLVATAFAGLLGSLAAAQGQSVPVDIQRPGSVDVVLVSATTGPGGKVLTTTDASGKGSISADDDKLINAGKWDVYEETCPGKDRVLLVPAGGQTPDGDSPNCKKRKRATILVKPGEPLNLGSAGMSAGTKALIGVAGGGGAVAAFLLAKSGGSNNQTASTAGSGTGTTPTSNNGTYEVNEAATTDTCNLAATIPVTLVVSGAALQGTEPIAGTNFTFTAASSNGTSFSGSASLANATETFSISTVATFSSNSVTLNQNIIGVTSGATCAYNLTGTSSVSGTTSTSALASHLTNR